MFEIVGNESKLREGWYIVSVNRALDPADLAFAFHDRKVVERIGHSNWVFHVSGGGDE
jgi:hypothetical protein